MAVTVEPFSLTTGKRSKPVSWSTVQLVPTFNATGSWTMTAAATPDVQALAVFDADGTLVPFGIVADWNGVFTFCGKAEECEADRTIGDSGQVVETLTFSGPDMLSMLAERIAYPDPTKAWAAQAVGTVTKTGAAESVIKGLITANCVSAAETARNYPLLAVAADAARGGSVTWKITTPNPADDTVVATVSDSLMDIWRAIAAQSTTPIGLTVDLDGTTLVADCYLPRDLSASAVFSARLGNLSEAKLDVVNPAANAILMQSAVTGANFTETIGAGAGPYRRVEQFADQSSATAAADVTQAQADAVISGEAQTTLSATAIDIPRLHFGADATQVVPLPTGAFLNPAAMGEASYPAAVADWKTWTGEPFTVTRQYYALSSFPVADANLTFDIANGIKCCIDLRPAFNPTSATDLANLDAMLSHWQGLGLQAEISLWAEPFNNGLAAAQFIAMWHFYAPTVRKYYPAVFCTSALSVQSNGENTYYPGDATVDKITTDLYAIRFLSGTRLDQAASLANNAVPPKPFGLWEFGAHPQGVNLLTGDNAHFEVTAGTWTGAGNATTPRSTLQAHTGVGSLAMTSVAAGNMTAAHCAAGNITTQGLPCAAGNSVACSAWVRAAVSARTAQVGATFYTSAGVVISSVFATSTAATDSATAWTQVTGTVTAPTSAAFCRLAAEILATGAAAEVHFLDDCSIGNLNTGQSQADIKTYFAYLKSYFAARAAAGKHNANLILFNSGSATDPVTAPIISAADFRLPLFDSLTATLTTSAGYSLGDLVSVDLYDGLTYTDIISAVTLTADATATPYTETVVPSIGTTTTDDTTISAALQQQLNTLERKIRSA